MTQEPQSAKTGDYFSRNYLRAAQPLSDDTRARHRLAVYLSDYFVDVAGDVGRYIETELGIPCRIMGTRGYFMRWDTFLKGLDLPDFLDVITATIRFAPKRRVEMNRKFAEYDLLGFAQVVFSEQNLAYRIDKKGGCHPLVDAAFSIQSASLIRSLSASGLSAAREHIASAEKALLAGSFDGRQAIRSSFDAAENLAKLMVKGATQLNKALIVDKLGPILLANSDGSDLERRATEKLVNSLTDWVEAAHFYRHASGSAEVEPPSESFTIAFVSQGFSFVRWIADAYMASIPKDAHERS